MSQLFTFITACRNSLEAWVRREIIDDDPWDEPLSESLDDVDDKDLQKAVPVVEPTSLSDVPQSSGRISQQ